MNARPAIAFRLALVLGLAQLAGCGRVDVVRPPEPLEQAAKAPAPPDQAEQLRLRNIQETQTELARVPAANRPNLLDRLARLQLDQQAALDAEAARMREIADSKPEHRVVFERSATDLDRRAATWRGQAIETLGRLVRDHPQHPRIDEHLFQLAAAFQAAGRAEEALGTAKNLIAHHPQSPFVPDAYLMFGEYYFAQAQIDKAILFYQKVAAFPDAAIAPYARYKLAWCYFNLGQFQEALAGFVALARETPESPLGREALKDSVLAFAHVGRADQAGLFFNRQFPDQELDLLDRLARTWKDQGRFDDQRQVDEVLLARLGCQARALEVRLRILQASLFEGDKPRVIEQAEALAAEFHRLAACLPAGQERAELEQVRAEAVRLVGELVRAWQIEQAKGPPLLGPLTNRLRAVLAEIDALR